MLSKISLSGLTGTAGMVGIVGSVISIILVNRSRDNVTKEDYYRNAFELLDRNKSAIDLIGEPIWRRRIDLSDHKNRFEPLLTQLKVPIKGSKRKGHLFVWAHRQDIQSQWTVRRLEIIFDDMKDKKVIVFKNE